MHMEAKQSNNCVVFDNCLLVGLFFLTPLEVVGVDQLISKHIPVRSNSYAVMQMSEPSHRKK